MSQSQFLALCSPGNLPELGMIKGLLESAKIDFFVINEEYAALGPVTGFANNVATVMVDKRDLEEAREMLKVELGYKF